MSENNNQGTIEELLKGLENFVTTKTVVGEAIHLNDTIILPLADATFGVGVGSFKNGAKDNQSGGMGGKVSPSAVLVIKDGTSKLINVKNQDGLTKILDMVPDLIEKFQGDSNSSLKEEKTEEQTETNTNTENKA